MGCAPGPKAYKMGLLARRTMTHLFFLELAESVSQSVAMVSIMYFFLCVSMQIYHSTYVPVRGMLSEVSFVLQMGFGRLRSGHPSCDASSFTH